ncbi:MAG: hypothetical protein JJ899_16380 [Alphaproteobacteria bacterium]|nr:hypothetical protein [Alphaproteobacteria bacterium]
MILAVILPLEIVEYMLEGEPPHNPADRSIAATPDVVDPRRPGVSLFQFDLYPFTGGHTQANLHVNSGLFRTGDHGFMIDFDLDAPPPKEENEIRVLLVGGSAAAGHGATENRHMIHNVMERYFAAENVCGDGRTLSVINLSMGGSRAFQNFIALNYWGHALEPDGIISLSGTNDQRQPFHPEYFGFRNTLSYQALAMSSNNPPFARFLAKRYPNIVNSTSLGLLLRALALDDISERVWEDYTARFPFETEVQSSISEYVHAIQSMRRDFAPLPVVVAYQPFMASLANPGKSLTAWGFDVPGRLAQYGNFIAETRDALVDKPRPGPLLFVDVHGWYQETWADTLDPGDGTHMWDNKQKLVGEYLIDRIGDFFCRTTAPAADTR